MESFKLNRQKILIGGSTPYSDNRGNAAIFGGLLEFLSEFNDVNFRLTVWHTYPESKERLLKDAATTHSNFGKENEQLNVNVVYSKAPESRFQALVIGNVKLLVSLETMIFYRILGSAFNLKSISRSETINALTCSDAIIELTFGDTFTDVYYGKIMWFYNIFRMILEFLSKKSVYFFPQSIGPFKSFFSRTIARMLLNNAKIVAVREFRSFKNVVELNVDRSKICFVPDMSFWLPIVSITDALNILQENGSSKFKSKRKVVAIMLSENIVTKRKLPMSLQEAAITIDRIIDELKVDVVLIPHGVSIGRAFDTRKFSLLIYKFLKSKDHAIVLKKDYSVEELWGVIGQCDMAISTLTHPVMSSLRQGIPIIALSYSHKTLGIMELFGMQDYVLTYDDFGRDKLISTAKEMLENSVRIKTNLITRRQFIMEGMENFKQLGVQMFSSSEESK